MKCISFLVMTLFISPSLALAAPNVSGISGSVVDGSNISIYGSAFGSNATAGTVNQEFIGPDILSGATGQGFSLDRWSIMKDWTYDMVYSMSNARGGTRTKCLDMTGSYSTIEAPLSYHLPSSATQGDDLFISYWYRVNWTGNGQYKVMRIQASDTVRDASGQNVWFFHNNVGGITWGKMTTAACQYFDTIDPANPKNTWSRIDLYMPVSTANTTIRMVKYIPGQTPKTENWSGCATLNSGDNINYIMWQNYFGTDGVGGMTSGDIQQDSIYVQKNGGQARVEICDSASWSPRTYCEIQATSVWSASSIVSTVSQGTWNNTNRAYLYV